MTTLVDESDALTPKPFYKSMIGRVGDISCGDDEDGIAANCWIKDVGFPTVRNEINRGTLVWTYENSADDMVGFGSLGIASWLFNGKPTRVQFIPALGVFHPHQGHPVAETGQAKYCYQILDHLIDEAESRAEDSPLLGLSVRKGNDEAIHIYEKSGFVWLQTEKKVNRMLMKLTSATEE